MVNFNIPEWFSKGTVYQINPRTFSKEGTINAIIDEIPFLSELSFSIIYLCPIFEEDNSQDIENWSSRQRASKTNNPKNPYRMNNYYKIDDEYGTMEDLKKLVDTAHSFKINVLLDLVYLHIGPNAPIITAHPEFVKHNEDGTIKNTIWNFPALNFESNGLREYLWCNMEYYIGEFGVDGFRCDVGDEIPLDFWAEGMNRIQAINPAAVLICEGSKWNYFDVFQAMYAFHWHDCIYSIISGNENAEHLRKTWKNFNAVIPDNSKLLRDMENHDTVTDWPERIENKVGHEGMEMIQVLNYIIDGIPMVYCGNEIADSSNLNMFANRFHMGKYETTDRTLKFQEYSLRRQEVIKTINNLKSQSDILCYGNTVFIENSCPQSMVSFEREYNGKKIVFICNFCDAPCTASLNIQGGNEIIIASKEIPQENNGEWLFKGYSYIVFYQ